MKIENGEFKIKLIFRKIIGKKHSMSTQFRNYKNRIRKNNTELCKIKKPRIERLMYI